MFRSKDHLDHDKGYSFKNLVCLSQTYCENWMVCGQIVLIKRQKMEKIWVGLKIFGGKNPKTGKVCRRGLDLGRFREIDHNFDF